MEIKKDLSLPPSQRAMVLTERMNEVRFGLNEIIEKGGRPARRIRNIFDKIEDAFGLFNLSYLDALSYVRNAGPAKNNPDAYHSTADKLLTLAEKRLEYVWALVIGELDSKLTVMEIEIEKLQEEVQQICNSQRQ